MEQASGKKEQSGHKLVKTIQLQRFKGIIITFLLVTVLLYTVQLLINPIAEGLVNREINALFKNRLKVDSVRVSLWRGILIAKGVQLIQPPDYGTGDLLTAEKLEIRIKIKALLKKKLAVSSITVKSPRINLIQLTNSRLNTEYYLEMFKPKTNSDASAKPSNRFTFYLNRFRIDKGELLVNSYRLSRRQPTFKFNNLKLEMKNICLPNPDKTSSPFKISGVVATSQPAKFEISGQGVLAAGALNFQTRSELDGLELADYIYLFPKSAVNISSGKVWLSGDTNCSDNYIVSKQHATIKNLKIKAKKGNLLSATFLGLPATAITKMIENNGCLNFDFTIQGYTNDLKENPKEIIGSAVSKGFHAKFGGGGGGVKKMGTGIKKSFKKVFRFKR